MYINEQHLPKQVLPNVEHLGELYNGNGAWRKKKKQYLWISPNSHSLFVVIFNSVRVFHSTPSKLFTHLFYLASKRIRTYRKVSPGGDKPGPWGRQSSSHPAFATNSPLDLGQVT